MSKKSITSGSANAQDHDLPSEYDLDPYQELIGELYIKQGHPLKKVMEIIGAKGCLATRNMYLRKIQAWGLEKNKKHEDMVQLLIQIRQRKVPSKLMIRGHEIEEAEVLTYFKRRQAIADRAAKGREAIKSGGHKAFEKPTHTIPSLQNLQSMHPLSSIITVQEPFYATRADLYTMYCAQSWILSPFKTGLQRSIDDSTRQQHSQLFQDLLHGAKSLQSQPQAGGALLERGFRQIAPLIKQASPDILRCLNTTLVILQYYRLIPVAEVLTRHFHQASIAIHGLHHPFTKATGAYLRNYNNIKLSALAAQICYDAAADILGRRNEIIIAILLNLTTALRASGGSFEDIASKYEALIQDSRDISSAERQIQLELEFGSFLALNGRYAQGVSYIRKAASPFLNGNWSDVKVLESSLYACTDLADVTMEQPEREGFEEDSEAFQKRYAYSEALMKAVLNKSEELKGPTSVMAIGVKHRLAEFYRRWGDPVHSNEEYDEIQKLLAEFSLQQ